jgi:hypothetical protein
MKQYILAIGGLILVVIFVGWLLVSQRTDDAIEPVAAVNAERQIECDRHLTVAIFPSGEAADEFMRACLNGEPVLPSDNPNSLPPPSDAQNETNNSTDNRVGAGCMIGGCSSQVCGEAGELDDMVTTCEYRSEYACYSLTRCEKQSTGRCGWTETVEYNQCRNSAQDEDPVVY